MREDLSQIAAEVAERAQGAGGRFLVAIAGPPAAGKSTLSAALVAAFAPGDAIVVPMDGFHFDDAVLAARGLSARKGAPETFDYRGFEILLKRIKAREPDIAIPVFDRSMELSRAAAAVIDADVGIILVEGNYLLLDEEPWRNLAPLFDLTLFVDVSREELDRRLVARWDEHGREREAARRWIDGNDMPNIDRVLLHRRPADMVI